MSFGRRWPGNSGLKLRLFGLQEIIHATHRFATVVYDFPAMLDDLLNVGRSAGLRATRKWLELLL